MPKSGENKFLRPKTFKPPRSHTLYSHKPPWTFNAPKNPETCCLFKPSGSFIPVEYSQKPSLHFTHSKINCLKSISFKSLHPRKLKMEPKDHPIVNQNHLPNVHLFYFWVQHVHFPGYKPVLFVSFLWHLSLEVLQKFHSIFLSDAT